MKLNMYDSKLLCFFMHVIKLNLHLCSCVCQLDSRFRDDKTGEGMSMSVMERKQGSAGSGSPVKDQLYYPSPYAMSHIPMFQKQGSPESECSQTLRRNYGREHIYDVPYPPKWVSSKGFYAK